MQADRGSGDADGEKFAAVMARYCDGETRAFEELYAGLGPRILGYLTSLVGEPATAEDLLQQTFMKLHQCRATYVRGANPVPWLYTIAHRTCIDEMRRRARSRVRLSNDGELPHEPTVDITGSAEALKTMVFRPAFLASSVIACSFGLCGRRAVAATVRIDGR